LFLLLVSFSIYSGKAQDSAIKINVKKFHEKLIPGNHYTSVFEIINSSNKQATLNCEFSVPKEFKLILSNKNFTLKPLQKKIVLYTFSIPDQCPSGNFKPFLKVTNNNNISLIKEFNPKVSKLYKLNIEPIKSPEFLRLEKDFFCEYMVVNNGNSTEKINFESKNFTKIVPTSAILKPDSTIVVKVFQKVPETFYNKTIIINNLQALINSKDLLFSSRIPITVYPNITKKPDLYHRFPISISTIFNSIEGTENISAFKYKLVGNGYLDRKNKHFLSLNYSGPNQREIVRFGEYEQYSLLYKTKKMETTIGDVNFSLSSLTETSRYGRGGIFNYKIGKVETSLFYVQPRFTNQISDSYGGKLIYNTSPKTYLQFGFIKRSLFEDNDEFNSQLYSLASFYTGNRFKINGEVAFEENKKTNGFGLSLESYLNLDKFSFYNSSKYSDKNFKGYLRNSKQIVNSLNYNISKKFNISANMNYSSINPVKDTINYSSSPITSKYQANLSYRFNRNNKLKVGAYIRTKEDQLFPKKYDFEERLLNLSFQSKKINRYNLNFENRYGNTTNFLSNNLLPKNVLFSSLNFSFNLWKNFIIGLTGEYQETNKQSIENNIEKSFYYGGHLQYYLRSNLDFSFFYRSGYDYDELFDEQSYLEADLNYNIGKNHILNFSASQSSLPINPNKKELFLTASYTFKINVPLEKDKTVGSLTGKIISHDKENLEGILVLLDDYIAITNKKGEFEFYNLKPKSYFLNIKRSSLPKSKIIIENLPLELDIIPNNESKINFTLGKTGNLFGQVMFKQSKTIQSTKFLKKLPNLIVKITQGQKKYYTQTDDSGNFKFKELTPGEWKVELLVKNLIKDFTFKKNKINITVLSNKTSSVKFEASNKNRQIKKSKKTFKL